MSIAKQTKILFSSHAGSPGGAEYALLSLSENIKHSSVLVFEEQGLLIELLESRNIPIIVCPMPAGIKSVSKADGVFKVLMLLPAILMTVVKTTIKIRHFDLLVPMSQKSFIILSAVKIILRKPLIWYMNDLLTDDNFSPFLSKVMVKLARLSADHVVLNSQASMDSWIKHGGARDNATVCYSGIDTKPFDALNRDLANQYKVQFFSNENPIIVMVGRISPWKGQHIFLEALRQLTDANAIIVGEALFGENQYSAELKNFVAEHKMEKRVTFAGHRHDIPEILAAADIFVHCSTDPEPFGRVIAEAMLAGTPVIASDAGGPKEILNHESTGLLTTPGNADELARAINRLLSDNALSERLSQAASQYAREHFSSDTMIDAFKKLASEYQ